MALNFMDEVNNLFQKEVDRIWEKARKEALMERLRELEDKCNAPYGVFNPTRKEDVIL